MDFITWPPGICIGHRLPWVQRRKPLISSVSDPCSTQCTLSLFSLAVLPFNGDRLRAIRVGKPSTCAIFSLRPHKGPLWAPIGATSPFSRRPAIAETLSPLPILTPIATPVHLHSLVETSDFVICIRSFLFFFNIMFFVPISCKEISKPIWTLGKLTFRNYKLDTNCT